MQVVFGLFSYGGVYEATVDSVIRELAQAHQLGFTSRYHRISGDALIPRSRSRALGTFYNNQRSGDVLVMIDHDLAWRPGDACNIAKEASEKKALVGGLYCKRTFGKGWSSRVPFNGRIEFGQPGSIKTDSVATGFLAIPWDAVDKIIDELLFTGEKFQAKLHDALKEENVPLIRQLCDLSIAKIADGAWKKVEYEYWDFFRCIRVPSNVGPNTEQFISEDWAFSMRCVHSGVDSYLSTYPVLTHYGDHGFTISDGMDDEAIKAHNATQQNAEKPEGPVPGAGGT